MNRKYTKDSDRNFIQNIRIVNIQKILTVILRKTYEL